MPLYEYICPECKRTEDRFWSVDERDHWILSCDNEDHPFKFMVRKLTPAHLHGSPNMPND